MYFQPEHIINYVSPILKSAYLYKTGKEEL